MRILCIDFGSKKIGLALSDKLGLIAQYYKTIFLNKKENYKKISDYILDIIINKEIEKIIIGLPKNMNGSEGKSADTVRLFVNNLKKNINIPILFEDERLSTVSAEKILLYANLSRRKRKRKIDSLSATFILQKYLDRINKLKRSK